MIRGALFLLAATSSDTRTISQCSVLVGRGRGFRGFKKGKNLKKIGMKAQDTSELFFNDVELPMENILGQSGQGFAQLMDELPQERLSIAVTAIAAAEAALSWTISYDKERTAFDTKIFSPSEPIGILILFVGLIFTSIIFYIINAVNTNKESLEDKKIRIKKESLQQEKIGKLFPKKK